jgi:hypothetical protein
VAKSKQPRSPKHKGKGKAPKSAGASGATAARLQTMSSVRLQGFRRRREQMPAEGMWPQMGGSSPLSDLG